MPKNPDAAELLEALASAVVLVAGDALAVRYVNAASEDLFRLSRKRVLDRPLSTIADFDAAWIERVRANLDATAPFTAREVAMRTADGECSHQVDATVTPMGGTAGAEQALIQLTAVDRQLRIARENGLREQERANRRLLRGVAHEIRNPLAGLRGAAQLLARELEAAELREYTDIIVREADRLRGLVDRMVGPVDHPAPEYINIHRLTEHVLQLLRAEAPPDVALRTDYDPSIPELYADADQLIQALLNLARNALQALDGNGWMMLRTSTRRRFTIGPVQHRLVACIEVLDNGPGIPPDLIENLFQPMISGRADGSGLGLTIAQSLVGRHGGLIECESPAPASDASTVFRVLLPLDGPHG